MEPIAESHRAVARTALKAAFGSAQYDAMVPLGGGASGAFPYRVTVRDRDFLVRIEGPASPLRNPHQYSSMRIAAEAGIAPRLYHVDEDARVAVMDFVAEHPLDSFPGGSLALARAAGALLRSVQATTQFPYFVDYPDIVRRLWAWVCSTGLFAPGILDPFTDHLERISEAYVWPASASVSSHNDPVPRNILFDGDRLWLIDWESAYRNDPLVDVAITLDNFAPSPALAEGLMASWLDRVPNEELRARLALVRALTRLYYAGVFLSASFAAVGAVEDKDVAAPTLAAFQQSVSGGKIRPDTPMMKHLMGKMYLASFLTDTVPPAVL